MAPSPEYDKEPKAPDKSATCVSSDDTKVLHNLVTDQQTNSDLKPMNSIGNSDVENNKHVETLDDGQLRALLDEAITYKCPKDREGKSSLFKELLEEVEQDEQACEAAARCTGGGRGSRRGARARPPLPHSNSLQDLVAALAAEPTSRRHHARHAAHVPATASVSARAIHGGSLPSGVDTSSLLCEEPARGAGYLATVRCVNPPPLAERRVSASDANSPHEMESLNRRSKPMFPMTYTARATLEIGSGSVSSGRAVTTTTASNQVDSAIPFSCITTPEVVSGCNTTPSASQSAAAADPKPRGVISSAFNGLPLSRPNYGSTASTASDEHKKSLDENGNAVQAFSSPLAGSGQHKKPRRKKSSKNETVIDCRQIDGYQGDKDVNELLRFIESDAESARPKLGRAKHRDDNDDKAAKKRSTERRKDKDHKAKRASSLEELSRTTLEELTGPRADPAPKPERRSWGETRDDPDPDPVPVGELTDFQTVTKRRKPRRRLDEQPRRRHEPPAPPSDHTGPNDSGDELESAHSPPPAAPPAPPPASYADIARTRHNIPDLIESCNYYAEGEEEGERVAEPPTLPADIKPGTGGVRPRRDGKAANAKRGKDRSPPAPDVVADRRPAVILLDAGARPPDMDGVTFGFDVNEQLVGGGGRRVDLLPGAAGAARGAGGVAVRAGALLVRYVPPPPPADTHHLLQIVDYVGNAWDEVVRCGGGKVRYYSE